MNAAKKCFSCGTVYYVLQGDYYFAELEDETLECDHSNESYWTVLPVVLFITLYKVVLTFESEDVILKCDNSNESSWAVLSCGSVDDAKEGDSNFWIDREMNR